MTNEKVFNYVGTSGKPLFSYFIRDNSWIYFTDGPGIPYSLTFEVYDTYRRAFSYSNKQGYYIGKDQNGRNMIIGAPDGGKAI